MHLAYARTLYRYCRDGEKRAVIKNKKEKKKRAHNRCHTEASYEGDVDLTRMEGVSSGSALKQQNNKSAWYKRDTAIPAALLLENNHLQGGGSNAAFCHASTSPRH